MRKAVEKVTQSAFGLSLFAELEKIGGGPLRYHLPEPLNWPLIYTSDIAPAIAAGMLCGWLGTKMGRITEWVYRGQGLNTQKYRQIASIGFAGLVSFYPIRLGIDAEMKPETYCNHDLHMKEVFSCKPDPVDAATVVFATELGALYVLSRRQREEELAETQSAIASF